MAKLRCNTHLAVLAASLLAAALVGCVNDSVATTENKSPLVSREARARDRANQASIPAVIELFAPADGDRVGVDGVGWFVDIAVELTNVSIPNTGFSGSQLTGPGVHMNAARFARVWAPGKDEHFAGFVTLISTSQLGVGGCHDLSNQYNLTGVTIKTEDAAEIWDTWIITAPNFGRRVKSILDLAEVADLDHNGGSNVPPHPTRKMRCAPRSSPPAASPDRSSYSQSRSPAAAKTR